jgi:ADP-heptose:LPS heptosyltransferase
MSKFLIIQTAFIGDVILATPIIEKIHAYYPEANIDFLLRKGNESLLIGHPYINKLIIWDKKGTKYKNLFKILLEVRKTKYNYIINLQRFFTTGLFSALSGADSITGFKKNPLSFFFHKKLPHIFGNNIHEIDRNLLLIEDITGPKLHKPKLYPSDKN